MDQICHKPQFQRLSTLHSILHSPACLFVCLFMLVYASGVKTTRVVTGIFTGITGCCCRQEVGGGLKERAGRAVRLHIC